MARLQSDQDRLCLVARAEVADHVLAAFLERLVGDQEPGVHGQPVPQEPVVVSRQRPAALEVVVSARVRGRQHQVHVQLRVPGLQSRNRAHKQYGWQKLSDGTHGQG